MLMSMNVLLMSINIAHDRIENWYVAINKKGQNGKKKRWFGLEVLDRYYRSLGSSTVVTLFKRIFVVNVPKLFYTHLPNIPVTMISIHLLHYYSLKGPLTKISQLTGQLLSTVVSFCVATATDSAVNSFYCCNWSFRAVCWNWFSCTYLLYLF